ncbi:MAG TPA: HAD-IC family P-type ATPase, partial [Nitrolancea sp.]|nr:HAD-IC family P-type ATPase [Nitrolancea sp.]
EIGSLLATIETPSTPLQRLITRLIRQLALVALLVCLLVGLLELLTGHGWAAAIIAAVSLAIAAIPEEFPMVYTLYLSLGAWRLARDHALVRRLTSVETLGSTTVICTDKTGTLTLGTVEVAGVAPVGSEVLTGQQPLTEPARALLEAAALASEPRPYDPLDQSILRFAEAHGIDTTALHRATLLHDYPFDPVRKHVTHVWQGPTGIRCVAKGAFEGLIEVTGSSGEDLREIRAANHRLAAQGMRVIAVASGNPANVTGVRGEDERGLRLAGLIAFSDPLRPGVRDALRRCREAGIRVILITGDHPATAHAVADSLELPHQDVQIATGADIDAADDSELATLVRRVNIFARTRPEQKYRLVTALRSGGEVVAMTGDGTNDAPALREADIGVAMGQRGTEVARAAAQLVLLDDNFATIVTAVRNGRRIFVNLQHAFAYLIAFHIPLLLTALLVPLVGLPLMLLPMHLIWLELIVHPTASLVFEADDGQDDVMRQPPRRQQDLIPRRELVRATVAGLVLTAAVFGLYAALIWLGHEAAHARASALVALIVGQMTLTLTERAYPRPINRAVFQSRTLLLVVAGVLATLFAGLYFPPAARILLLAPLGHTALLASIVVGLAATLWSQPLARSRTHHQPR